MYVALVPQTQADQGNDGFCVIHLPMDTNIGVLDSIKQPLPEPTDEQVSLFEKLSKKLRFKYDPLQFNNPSLHSFYTNLEALVFDEEAAEIVDLTMPEYNVQDVKIEPFLQQIEDEFGTEMAASGSRGKRTNDGESNGARPKAPKKDMSMSDIEQAVRNARVESVTVDHLKTFLREKKVQFASSATKKVLFALAENHVD